MLFYLFPMFAVLTPTLAPAFKSPFHTHFHAETHSIAILCMCVCCNYTPNRIILAFGIVEWVCSVNKYQSKHSACPGAHTHTHTTEWFRVTLRGCWYMSITVQHEQDNSIYILNIVSKVSRSQSPTPTRIALIIYSIVH